MHLIHASVLLAGIFAPAMPLAEGKDEPRPLAAEAAYLAEKGGLKGWVAEEVPFTRDEGKKKAKGKLRLTFWAEKGKPARGLHGIIIIESESGPKSIGVRGGGSPGIRFALEEKDGKRHIKIMEGPRGRKEKQDPKVLHTLEYSIKAGKLTVKPGAFLAVSGWDLDRTRAVVFEPSREWAGILKDEGPRKEAPVQINTTVGYVADAKAWEKLWTAWRGKEDLPKVDFERELVLVVTASGPNQPSPIQVVGVGPQSDLRFTVSPTKAAGPGFGYYLAVQPRKGLKTILGKPIKAK